MVFITEKKNVENQQFEGCHSDQTIEGSGDKLLHLLEKFSTTVLRQTLETCSSLS